MVASIRIKFSVAADIQNLFSISCVEVMYVGHPRGYKKVNSIHYFLLPNNAQTVSVTLVSSYGTGFFCGDSVALIQQIMRSTIDSTDCFGGH